MTANNFDYQYVLSDHSPAVISDMVIDSSGCIYVYMDMSIVKLYPNGTIVWFVEILLALGTNSMSISPDFTYLIFA